MPRKFFVGAQPQFSGKYCAIQGEICSASPLLSRCQSVRIPMVWDYSTHFRASNPKNPLDVLKRATSKTKPHQGFSTQKAHGKCPMNSSRHARQSQVTEADLVKDRLCR